MTLATVTLSSCCISKTPLLQAGRQLDFRCKIDTPEKSVLSNCLIDTGAWTSGFINSSFARQHKLPLIPLTNPYSIRLADDKVAQQVTHITQVHFRMNDHVDDQLCLVINLRTFDLILGMPWLKLHDPQLSFRDRSLSFDSDHCMAGCLLHGKPVTIYSKQNTHKTSERKFEKHDITQISAYAFTKEASRSDHQVIAM